MSLSVFQVKNQCLKLVTLSTSTSTYNDLLVYIVAIGKPLSIYWKSMGCVRVKWVRAVSVMCQYRNRFYSNAGHIRCIRKGSNITKPDACTQKMHRTHAVCIQLNFFWL